MTWFKVDDSFCSHPKRLKCTAAAIGLWTVAGAWCAQQLTDGHVPVDALTTLAGKRKEVDVLVKAGLWEVADDGWQFHDWADWQPSRKEILERRDAEARRKAEWRRRRQEQQALSRRDNNGTPASVPPGVPDVSRSSRPSPDPTRPDQEPLRGSSEGSGETPARKRATRIPDDFAVTPEMVDWARDNTPGVDGRTETDKFVDYWRGRAGKDATKVDWIATWRNWMRRAQDDAGSRNGGRHAPTDRVAEAKRRGIPEALQ